jgi:apolipoprotein N-acyltransferase
VQSTYIKRYLTPFGEYMPLRKVAEFVSPFAKSVNDFKPGSAFAPHVIAGYQVAPIICYEIINDGLVRESANRSGGIIVQTNSATFSDTAESRQQLAITRIRAIEQSREILSVSTIGISAFIDNNGKVKSETSENVQSALTGSLTLSDHVTMQIKWGNALKILILSLFLLFGLRNMRNRKSI